MPPEPNSPCLLSESLLFIKLLEYSAHSMCECGDHRLLRTAAGSPTKLVAGRYPRYTLGAPEAFAGPTVPRLHQKMPVSLRYTPTRLFSTEGSPLSDETAPKSCGRKHRFDFSRSQLRRYIACAVRTIVPVRRGRGVGEPGVRSEGGASPQYAACTGRLIAVVQCCIQKNPSTSARSRRPPPPTCLNIRTPALIYAAFIGT